ncbi:MAG: putative porin [Gemmatimonadaceae bacterium]
MKSGFIALALVLPAAAQGQPATDSTAFRVFGDVRVRYEGIYEEDVATRHRARFRVRAGGEVAFGSRVRVGSRLVSGDPGNPLSTNEDLGDAFTHKPIGIDWAYVTFRPRGDDRIALTGGKFDVLTFQPRAGMLSELLFDADLSPEGFSERFTLRRADEGRVRLAQLNLQQWAARENSAESDAWLLGAQGVVAVALGEHSRLTLALADWYVANADGLARAGNDNERLTVTNSVVLRDGQTIGGVPIEPDPANPVEGFATDFNIVNASAELVLRGLPQWPLTLFADVALNTEAADANTATWTGASLGALDTAVPWRFSVIWMRTETDAVLSMLNHSEMRRAGGTNVEGLVAQAEYLAAPRLVLSVRHHVGSFVRAPVGVPDRAVHRLQVSASAGF